MGRLQDLAALLMQKPTPPVGSGMLQQGVQTIQSRPYQLHQQEAQAMGQTPMTPQQFAAQNQGR